MRYFKKCKVYRIKNPKLLTKIDDKTSICASKLFAISIPGADFKFVYFPLDILYCTDIASVCKGYKMGKIIVWWSDIHLTPQNLTKLSKLRK